MSVKDVLFSMLGIQLEYEVHCSKLEVLTL